MSLSSNIHTIGISLIICCLLTAVSHSDEKSDLLRQEIEVLQQRIDQTEAGKQGIIRQLQNLDLKVDLHRRLIRQLEVESGNSQKRLKHLNRRTGELEAAIDDLSDKLLIEETSLTKLRRQAGDRISYMYKHLFREKWTLLLGSENINDLSQRQKYLKAVARFDKIRLDKIRQKRNIVRDNRQRLVNVSHQLTLEKARRLSELEKARQLINSKRLEEKELTREKDRRQTLLDKIAGDTELLQALLEERQRSLQQIEWEIQRLEGHRPVARKVWQPDVPFDRLYGKLPWPLDNRRITQPYGRIRHPKLGTTTINPGVDLYASTGDAVYGVARGEVTRISWLRGFGNTVILSHGGGYYTVYARLGSIFVSEGEVVEPGRPIGEVGDSGGDPSFHFEVWSKRNQQDPVKWLE